MESFISVDRLRFLLTRFRDRLWVRPLVVCLLSIAAVFAAKLADGTHLKEIVPEITPDSIETLLSVMASSMLVIATFSVGSMVSAFASASSTATPRSFSLVAADNSSKNALSTFVGAFIFSVVALTAFENAYFDKAGIFILYVLTVGVFAIVVITFVRWVDSIARLGRLGQTIKMVEKATSDAMKWRRGSPTLGGIVKKEGQTGQHKVFASDIGYVQHIDISVIQGWAEDHKAQVVLAVLPGKFVSPEKVLAYVDILPSDLANTDFSCIIDAFQIGDDRYFSDDPRFGLVVLSEIAGRALSPAINDPGSAIKIIGTMVRLFSLWNEPEKEESKEPEYDRVAVPEIEMQDMFDDAFTAIARDGAGTVEVCIRLQKALHSLALLGDDAMRDAAKYHGNLALERAQKALVIEHDLKAVQNAASFATDSAKFTD
ncbi:hypothetical protein LCGC14_0581350 [marine sediment metagenome]|uniref:DUF2254 domain-containing protein n=1 Tax=marine sediment metagenome TaxID=412755 RepID=A0A0F9U2F7_9ZZZZ|nr:DUF2254 domain-containing protein [Methylophaga sp.]